MKTIRTWKEKSSERNSGIERGDWAATGDGRRKNLRGTPLQFWNGGAINPKSFLQRRKSLRMEGGRGGGRSHVKKGQGGGECARNFGSKSEK